jgi:DNA-binding CsgD family transcriptional regulator
VPDGLGEAIGTRLARLSDGCQRVLTIAAVIGREPALQTIEAVADDAPEVVGAALGEAVRAAVLQEQSLVGGVAYRFTHALFRQTLYAELPAAERLRLHPRVARALEEQLGTDGDHLGALAEHFARSAEPDDLRKALDYSQRAAGHAAGVYASAEAARLLGHALMLQETVAPDDLPLRCDLLTAQGQALLDAGEARHTLDEIATPAFALAEHLNDPVRASAVCALAMACFQNAGSSHALAGPESGSWARRADRWAQPGTITRVWADAFLGVQSYFRERWFDGLPLLRQALDGARLLGDLETLWWMRWLWVGYANTPQHAAEQLQVAEEIAAQPRSGVSARTLAYALSWTAATLLAQGQRTRADAIWHELVDLAARSGQPSVQVQAFRGPATMAALDGRLEEAAAIAQQSIEYSAEAGLPDHGLISAGLIGLRPLLLLGRYDDTVRLVTTGTAPLKAVTMAHVGQYAEARAYLDEGVMARPDFGTERDVTHQYMDVFRLEAAVLVRHQPAAARLLDRLAPLTHITTGVRLPTCVARHLGAAAAMLGRTDEALDFYRSALDTAHEMRFRPEIALTHLGLAELLLDAFPARRDEAIRHLDLALPEIREMKMAPALARAEALTERLQPANRPATVRARSDGLTPREVEVLGLVAAGKSNAEIAETLIVSVRTAERHIANIYAKLGAGGPTARAVATSYAHTRGLVQTVG